MPAFCITNFCTPKSCTLEYVTGDSTGNLNTLITVFFYNIHIITLLTTPIQIDECRRFSSCPFKKIENRRFAVVDVRRGRGQHEQIRNIAIYDSFRLLYRNTDSYYVRYYYYLLSFTKTAKTLENNMVLAPFDII